MLEELDDFFLDPEMQAQIRADFAESQHDAVEKMREHIAKGELTLAEIVAHNLKSISTMMVENTLAEAALALEWQLKKGEIPQDNALDEIALMIKHVLDKA